MEKIWYLRRNYDEIQQTSLILPMETLSLASLFSEEFDSFRNVTYESEDHLERELEGDSENNSDNCGSNDDNDFDYDTRNAFDTFADM